MGKYSKKQMADALRETKGQITLACRRVGCAYTTMRRYIDKYPELLERMATLGLTPELLERLED